MLCENLSVTSEGELLFAGRRLSELAEKYGTALYVMDEDRIRKMCRIYQNAMKRAFGESALPLYASKACSFTHMYRIMREENMGIDVVFNGELEALKKPGNVMVPVRSISGKNEADGRAAKPAKKGGRK